MQSTKTLAETERMVYPGFEPDETRSASFPQDTLAELDTFIESIRLSLSPFQSAYLRRFIWPTSQLTK